MSFILDALRRAESERARGQVPGLHAPAPLPDPAATRSARPSWVLWGALLLLLAGAALWWLLRPPAVMPTPASAAAAGAAAIVLPPPLAPAQPDASPSAPVPSAAVLTQAPREVPRELPPPMPQVVSAPAPVPSASAPAALVPAASVPLAAPRVLKLAELPADLRRDWPQLTLGGSVWSESATHRFVIVNGLLLHEGEAVSPGLVVDRIGPRSVVLRWREQRVEVPL